MEAGTLYKIFFLMEHVFMEKNSLCCILLLTLKDCWCHLCVVDWGSVLTITKIMNIVENMVMFKKLTWYTVFRNVNGVHVHAHTPVILVLFNTMSRPAQETTQPPIQWVPGDLSEGKAAEVWSWPLTSI